jgi:antitoxin ParD1/3/4
MRQLDRASALRAKRELAPTRCPAYTAAMNVPLTPEQVAWLERKVAEGQFASLEEAAAAAINDTISSETGDLAWAAPLVEEARASVGHGRVLTHDEFKQFLVDERSELS